MTPVDPAMALPAVGQLESNGPIAAGFWRRYLAYGLDWLLLSPVLWLVLSAPLQRAWLAWQELTNVLRQGLRGKLSGLATGVPDPLQLARELLQDGSLQSAATAASARLGSALGQGLIIAVAVAALYFITFEASPWSATPGKRALDLKVLDASGQRIGWLRAVVRFAAGSLSWLSLNLGHALVAWRRDGRGLHDLIAGTQVLTASPLPRWARWLLYGQGVLVLGALLVLLGRLAWLMAQLAQLSSA